MLYLGASFANKESQLLNNNVVYKDRLTSPLKTEKSWDKRGTKLRDPTEVKIKQKKEVQKELLIC